MRMEEMVAISVSLQDINCAPRERNQSPLAKRLLFEGRLGSGGSRDKLEKLPKGIHGIHGGREILSLSLPDIIPIQLNLFRSVSVLEKLVP